MALLDPQMLEAVIAATGGASDRALRARLGRRPTFGQTLTQSLAAGLGGVPGQVIGDYAGEYAREPGRQNQRDFEAAQAEKLRTADLEKQFQEKVQHLGDQRFATSERLAGQDFLTAQNNAPTPVPGFLPKALDLPAELQPGPEGIVAGGVLGPLTPGVIAGANKAAGALGPTAPAQTVKHLGDLFTAKSEADYRASQAAGEAAKNAEAVRSHQANEKNFADRTASMDRVAQIRAKGQYDKQDPRALIAKSGKIEDALRAARTELAGVATSPYIMDKAAETDRINGVIHGLLDEKEALAPYMDRAIQGPPPKADAGGAVAPPAAKGPAGMDDAALHHAASTLPPGPDLDAVIAELEARLGAKK